MHVQNCYAEVSVRLGVRLSGGRHGIVGLWYLKVKLNQLASRSDTFTTTLPTESESLNTRRPSFCKGQVHPEIRNGPSPQAYLRNGAR